MLAWWMLVPTLLAMMVALVLPGFMWLRAGGRSSLVAIGAAPAFTFGLVTALSVAYPALDIEWEPSTACLLYTSPSPRDYAASRMPSSA